MKIIVEHNCVHVQNVDLSKNFSDLIVDIIIDRYGRVKVKTGSKLSFYTDLNHIPAQILMNISKKLNVEPSNRILAKIKKKIDVLVVSS